MILRPALLAAFLAVAAGASAQPVERPLLMEGTQSVFQRILTRPGAPLHPAPEAAETVRLPAFQPFYVYERRGDWLRVGRTQRGGTDGWLAAASVVDWRQNIVGAFTNPSNRQRSLLFAGEEGLRGLMEHEALAEMQAGLLAQADAGTLPPEAGVVAAEPDTYVSLRDSLYIMPILDFVEDLHPLTYEDNLLMQVAVVPQEEAPAAAAGPPPPAGEFDAGVVFVLDTTRSMGPFIERTRRALARIIMEIEGTDVGARLNFGVIGFRDNPGAVPGLEYRTRTLIPLERRTSQADVLAALGEATQVTTANSPGFNEDSLAGVEDAIDTIDWEQGGADPFDGRYVILITDAGPKDPRDPNTRSPIGPAELQRDAEGKGIVVMTLHLKTPAGGEANHAYAAEQYGQLSRFGQSRFYFPIEGGAEDGFESTVERVVTALTDHVRLALGEATVLDEAETGSDLADLGRALQLRYLGRREGTRPPDVIEGWLSQKAVENPRAVAVEPRLLITKSEMATMASLLDNLLRLAESNRDDEGAETFFAQVQGVVADMATNPDNVVTADARTLGGALEYLERLPYRSQLLQMTQEIWSESAMRRRPVIDGMRQKLTQYRKWLYDGSVWTALYEGAPDGEHVFAMPFDVLP